MKTPFSSLFFALLLETACAANDTNTTSEGLSGGAVAGIIIGVVAGIGILGAVVWFLFFKQGAMYASVIGRGGTASTAASIASSAGGVNNLPMMAMKVSVDDDL